MQGFYGKIQRPKKDNSMAYLASALLFYAFVVSCLYGEMAVENWRLNQQIDALSVETSIIESVKN